MTKQVEFRGLLPYLYYEDAGAMLDWLSRVFGFEERGRYIDKDGIVRQAEMLVGENELWFSGHGPGFWEAKGGRPDTWIGVWVDDVDAMYDACRGGGRRVGSAGGQGLRRAQLQREGPGGRQLGLHEAPRDGLRAEDPD